jgi:hypothetical protein
VSAWADYLDGRLQVIHQWKGEGASIEEISVRLEVDPERIEIALRTEPVPYPGSSRAQLAEWRARAERLELALQRSSPSEPPPGTRAPVESEMRALRMHPTPELCGCQYWADAAPDGAHNPRCIHAKA